MYKFKDVWGAPAGYFLYKFMGGFVLCSPFPRILFYSCATGAPTHNILSAIDVVTIYLSPRSYIFARVHTVSGRHRIVSDTRVHARSNTALDGNSPKIKITFYIFFYRRTFICIFRLVPILTDPVTTRCVYALYTYNRAGTRRKCKFQLVHEGILYL